jgi:hypothetical protein
MTSFCSSRRFVNISEQARTPPESSWLGYALGYGASQRGLRCTRVIPTSSARQGLVRFAAPSLNVRTMKHNRVWAIEVPCQGLSQLD